MLITLVNYLLSDFDLGNLTVLLLFLFPSIINFGIAIYVFFCLPKKGSNDFFIAFLFLLGLWQFCEGMVHLSLSLESAHQWLKMSRAPALLISPVWFLFILKFTGWNKKISGVVIFTFFLVPSLFFLMISMAGMDKYHFVQSEIFGWIVNPVRNLSTISMYLWIAVSTFIIMVQLWVIFYKERKNKIIRNQFFLLAIGFTVPIIGGISFEIIRPVFWGMDNIPLASPLLTLFSFSIIVTIRKYHFLEFSPHHQWENIIETMNEGIMIVNNEDYIMYANKKFCEMTGYPMEELSGKIAYELFLEDEQQKREMQNKIKDRKKNIAGQFELQVRKKSGEKRWLLINGSPCAGRNGNVIGSIGIHTDITEQKKIESDLIFSETKFRTLFDSTRDAVMLLDNIGFFDCNAATLKMFGCSTKEEFCSKHPADLSPPFQSCGTDSLTLANHRISTAMEFGSNSFEWIHKRADTDKDFPAEVLLSRMELDGRYVLQATVRDITNRKKRELDFMASLKEISDYKYALNQSSVVSITDHQGTIKYANEKFCEISKYSKDELIGQNHNIVNSGYHPKEFFQDLWKTILNGKVWRQDVKNKAKDGTCFWSDTVIVPFVDISGKPYQFVAMRNEITQRKIAEEKIRESEEKFKNVFEQSPLGISITAIDGTLNANKAFQNIVGYSENELQSLSWQEITYPGDIAANVEIVQSILRGELTSAFFEKRYIHKNGNIVFAEINTALQRNERGEPLFFITLINDTTKRKKTEEALADSNQFNKQIIQGAQDGIIVYDRDLRFKEWNHFMEEFTGIPASEVLGRHPSEVFPFLEKAGVIENIEKAMAGEIATAPDFYFKVPGSGKSGWSLDTNAPLINIKGEIIGVIGTVRDITNRKKAEEALLRSETNLRAIFENTSTGFLLMDTDFNILKFNNRGSELALLAFGRELAGNINLLKILPAGRQQVFFERQSRVLQGETINYETFYTLHDDSLLWLEINSKPVTDDRNSIIGISFAINDISERKKTEKKLLETIKEIDTFIFRSSHDLKSPVSSLKGLIMLMKKEISDKKALEYVIMVEKANLRMEDIVNDLSSVVLIKDASRKDVEINLFQEINSTIELNNFSLGQDKIHFEVGVERDLCFFSDRILISAICQNLIGNAIKYRMRDDGHIISIKAEKKSNKVLFIVSDNGEGISIKPIEKIFEMFYRGNLKSTGTGLGLYIVKKAVEKLGGTIKVESEPRKGTTFSVCIPLGNP